MKQAWVVGATVSLLVSGLAAAQTAPPTKPGNVPAGWVSGETRLNKVWVSPQGLAKLEIIDPRIVDLLEIASLPKRAQLARLLQMATLCAGPDPEAQQALSRLGTEFDKLESLLKTDLDAGALLDDLLASRRELSVLAELTSEDDPPATVKLRSISNRLVPSAVGMQSLKLRSMIKELRSQEREKGRQDVVGARKINIILNAYTVEGADNVLDLTQNYKSSGGYARDAAAKTLYDMLQAGALAPKCREIRSSYSDPGKSLGLVLAGISTDTGTRCGL